jgi:hypothetical protein
MSIDIPRTDETFTLADAKRDAALIRAALNVLELQAWALNEAVLDMDDPQASLLARVTDALLDNVRLADRTANVIASWA